MERQGIWITGVGCATSLGTDFKTLGDNLLAGRSGVGPVTDFDASGHSCRIAACMRPLPTPPGWDGDDFRGRERSMRQLIWCAVQALQDAGLWADRRGLRIGVVFGIGAEWAARWERDTLAGGRSVYETSGSGPGRVAELRDLLRLDGPFATVAAACASGNVALGIARQWLDDDWCDVVLAGGAEGGVSPISLAGFGNLGALSRRNAEPTRACRPFDRARDGFIMGEGGAMLILESEAHGRRRGVTARGQLLGYGARSDAFHQVMPATDPRFAAAAITTALADAGLHPADVDYINAHATSTPAGDIFETRALRQAFGAALSEIPVSGTKSMTGHLLGGAAAVEAVVGLIALERQTVPPTLNLDDVDPECELRHVPNHAIAHPMEVILSNSFGFGGNNTALLLGRPPLDARRAA